VINDAPQQSLEHGEVMEKTKIGDNGGENFKGKRRGGGSRGEQKMFGESE